jgi:hypothetical protein
MKEIINFNLSIKTYKTPKEVWCHNVATYNHDLQVQVNKSSTSDEILYIKFFA